MTAHEESPAVTPNKVRGLLRGFLGTSSLGITGKTACS